MTLFSINRKLQTTSKTCKAKSCVFQWTCKIQLGHPSWPYLKIDCIFLWGCAFFFFFFFGANSWLNSFPQFSFVFNKHEMLWIRACGYQTENESNCCWNENTYSGEGPALCSLLEEKWCYTEYIYFRVLVQIRRTGFVLHEIKLQVQLMCSKL